MEVHISTYRNRIGNFSTIGHNSYIQNSRKTRLYQSSTNRSIVGRLAIFTFLLSVVARLEYLPLFRPVMHEFSSNFAPGTNPVNYLILAKDQMTVAAVPALFQGFHDVLTVHSATSVHVHYPGRHVCGLIVAAVPLKFSILSDSNFYARYTYGNRSSRGIKLTHWNAGNAHLENKNTELEQLISDHHPHLLGISEANLFSHHCVDNCKIADYELITSKTLENLNLRVSRVVVYKHISIVAKVREDLMSDRFSSIWLEVGFPGRAKILVCNLYREWQYMGQVNNSSLEFTEQMARWIIFLEQWEKALDSGKECVVMGDFNLDFLSFSRSDLPSTSQAHRMKPLVDEMLARIAPHGVQQCVVGPTRQGRGGQPDSGLDHLWTNCPGKMSQIYTRYNGSDHKVIMGIRFAKLIRNSTRYIKKRSFKNFNEEIFLERIRSTSWWDLYQTSDVNLAVQLFTSKINCILDEMAPVRTYQTNSKYCPWLTDSTKELISERNRAQKYLSENKNDENLSKYKTLRNKVTSSLRADKQKWQKQKLKSCSTDPGSLWKNVLGWLNWCSSGAPSKLYQSGQIVTSPAKLAEIMNNYFVNKVATICQGLPKQTDDPTRILKKIMMHRTSTFSLSCVHPESVRKIIVNLKNSKSCGVDTIDTNTLKIMVDDILPAVTHIVNLSIQQSVFPAQYKIAKVIPLLKKGDPLLPKNYRPVAILCVLSKVVERVVYLQVVDYMNRNNFFHPNHHGFRAHHSPASAMIQMYDTWVQAVDKGQLTGVCMLDMSAAFDVVDHGILLEKLKLYGFDIGALKWMEDYLTGRSQAVYIDGALSAFLSVSIGVPQGSILGPLCYVLFTNDLPETVLESQSHVHFSNLTTDCKECGGLCCFADDSTYSVASDDQDTLEAKLNAKYRVIAEYMGNNRLKLNDDKTHLLIMTTQQRQRLLNIKVKISTPSEVIKPIKSEKLLGIIIQDNLKWTNYIQNNKNSLLNQLNTRLNAIRMLSSVASFKVRLMVANGIFSSKLIFQIGLWGGTEEYLLNSLQVVQNKAARLVARRSKYTPIVELIRQCGWLSIRQLIFYHSVIGIHKTIQTSSPKYIFSKLSKEFPYNTRLAETSSVRMGSDFKCKLELTEKSYLNRATVNFNQLPTELRQIRKSETFKKQLKDWVLDNYRV